MKESFPRKTDSFDRSGNYRNHQPSPLCQNHRVTSPDEGRRTNPRADESQRPPLSSHGATTYLTTSIFQFVWGLVKYLPSPVGDPIRRAVLALVCAECRVPPFWIRTGIDIWWPGNIRVGRSSLNENVFLNGYGGITIGDHCLIARGACFFSGGHTFDRPDILIVEQPLARAPIVVEDDVYFGLNCIILGGIHIGRGAIIGAGSVVTDSVPSGAIVAGVPARVIRFRDGYSAPEDAPPDLPGSSLRTAPPHGPVR